LAALTLVRLVVAAMVPLAPDEAYYWVWSRVLQPGYLDHPPMVALWVRLGTAIGGQNALGVRLLGPIGALVGSLLLADAGERLFAGRGVGARSAALLNATLMVGAGSVTMTPDTPLLFFAVVALWALVRAGEGGRWWWLVVGVAVGAAMASKYTGVLLGFAVPAWLIWTRRWEALRSGWLWAGGAVALAVFAPVLVWNGQHEWVSLLKQGGRAGDWRPERAAQFVAELVGGQVGLATPGIFALFAAGLWRAVRRAAKGAARRDGASTLLVALALPGVAIFAEHALGDRVQANWLALLYPPLAIAAARWGAGWWRLACGFGLGLTALVYVQAVTAALPLPALLDPTMRLAGWDGLARDAAALAGREGLGFIASEEYSQAAELAWWAPAGTEVLGVQPRWALFRLDDPAPAAGLLLVSARRSEGPDALAWTDISELGPLVRARGGVEAERFRVYRVLLRTGSVAKIGVSAKILPRPRGE